MKARTYFNVAFLCLLLSGAAFCQQGSTGAVSTRTEKVFTVAEQSPQFPGGEEALNKYFAENLRQPGASGKKAKKGVILTTFIVTETGSVEDVRIVKSKHKSLNSQVIQAIENMPAWIPAKQRGRNVAFHLNLPVSIPGQSEAK